MPTFIPFSERWKVCIQNGQTGFAGRSVSANMPPASGRSWINWVCPGRDIALLYYHAASRKRETDRFLTDDHYFLEWGEAVLNPMLNHHLNRETGKPTFQNMMLYLMREEVKKYDDLMKRTRPRGYPDHPDYRR